ncbi:chaperone modulator CbpM [Ramlibacter sp. H39-3-26]|uniref:chaperone modulator CbpM n=1 Tax=Curvibacter soli TaxID=3031331 RepID=UPI0023DA6997|nr:chaperone modulator CbpM [Ramlibacter sp. H39-3-26]MDF1485176.1 chaperone modulator CbpM [Ramlibacter sp. H39-3-26]
MTTRITITAATIVGAGQPLDAQALARACNTEIDWVAQAVEAGILQAEGDAPAAWRFHSVDLRSALEARRLQRDFGVELEAAALILDLGREVRRLRARLHAHGLGLG